MVKYLGKRIFYIVLTLFIVSTITFFSDEVHARDALD